MIRIWPILALLGCFGSDAYIVEGTVVQVTGHRTLTVDHKEIDGFMPAMVMDFEVADRALLSDVKAGDKIVARMHMAENGALLNKVRVTGRGPAPKVVERGPLPLRSGQPMPHTDVTLSNGDTLTLGASQGERVLLTFLYTTCPMPDYCPAMVGRLMGEVQSNMPSGARVVVVTHDPDHDTLEVLGAYAKQVGANPDRWVFGRVEQDVLETLAMRAGLSVMREGGQILHGHRFLVLDADGSLIERYDDNRWSEQRVLEQLRTGKPYAPPGTSGTLTPGL